MKKYNFIVPAIILGALVCGDLDNVHAYEDPGKAPMDDYFLANTYELL
ncbi:MAG: hypothetical protein GX843_04370 [Synergistaceae bacterium]|nr:hypothetical protein [Synergistaceae bacterium]